ncbi:MAG: hypothetical protein HC838_00500 [Spirulinaceae cyanobacterium RM2_2_10]|nr:hypothetical protein [Spirulinaceae cyanobacterium RM2_2_10]
MSACNPGILGILNGDSHCRRPVLGGDRAVILGWMLSGSGRENRDEGWRSPIYPLIDEGV